MFKQLSCQTKFVSTFSRFQPLNCKTRFRQALGSLQWLRRDHEQCLQHTCKIILVWINHAASSGRPRQIITEILPSAWCPRRHLIDLISTVSILADEFVGSANSNLSANVVTLFVCVQHANVANVWMEKKQSFAPWNAMFHTSSQQNIFQVACSRSWWGRNHFTNVLLVTCGMPMFIKWGANTWNQTGFETVWLAEGYDPVDLIGACGMGETEWTWEHVDAICFGTWLTHSQSADAHVPNSWELDLCTEFGCSIRANRSSPCWHPTGTVAKLEWF